MVDLSDEGRCPVCGEPYAQRIVVERGDQWADLFPGTPLDFFRRYRRRCAAQHDVTVDRQRSEDQRVVYFHGDRQGGAVL